MQVKCGEYHEEGSKQHLQTEDSRSLETDWAESQRPERMSLGLRAQHAQALVLHALGGSGDPSRFLAQSDAQLILMPSDDE